MTDYQKQALEFCQKHGVTVDIKYSRTGKHFHSDKENRDIYSVTITRGSDTYIFEFGDSVANTEKNMEKITDYRSGRKVPTGKRKQVVTPTAYDVLACITKSDPGQFDDFIADYGCTFNTEREYLRVKQLHLDVLDEYKNVSRLFRDCMDELFEIC